MSVSLWEMGCLGVCLFWESFSAKKICNKACQAHLHAAAKGGEYVARVNCTYGLPPAHNLNLVSSTWAEVKVGKEMLSILEASAEKKVTSKQSKRLIS